MGIATALRTTPYLGWFFCLHRTFYTDSELLIKARQPAFGQLLSCTQWPCDFQPLSIESRMAKGGEKCWIWFRGNPLESGGRRCERFEFVPCRLPQWPVAWEELQGSDELHTRSPKLLSGCTGRWAEDGGAVSLRPALMFKALPCAPWLLRRKRPDVRCRELSPLMT